MQKKIKQGITMFGAVILSIGNLGGGSPAFAAKIQFDQNKTMIKEIELKGDLRLRQENFDHSFGTKDRQRQRIRYRQEINVKLPHNIKVKSRLASGGTDPVSTNQTLGDNASTKGIQLDRAYLEYKPGPVKIQAGKMKNPFPKTTTSNLMWDTDYNPEGASQHISGLAGALGWFVTLGQFTLDEISGDTKDPYLFSEMVGGEVKLPGESKAKLMVAHHEFANVRNNIPTNSGTGNSAATQFSIFQAHLILSTWLFGQPLSFEFNKLQNMAANKVPAGAANAEEEDKAVAASLKIGKAKKKGSWQAAYTYKEIEMDAHLQGISDSDFHDGAVNSKGHVISIAYAIADFIKAQITHFDTEDKRVVAGMTDGSFTRTQFDLITKFK